MRILLISISVLLLGSVHAQFSRKDITRMKRILDEYSGDNSKDLLAAKYPGMDAQVGRVVMGQASDTAVFAAVRTGDTLTVGPFPSSFGDCALVRILHREVEEYARVNYIYLANSSGSGPVLEARADSILQAVKGGWPFAEAALKYSMDGNGKKGGDLGWFKLSDMVKEFSDALRPRPKGELYTASVGVYGWYVVQVTEAPTRYEDFEYLIGLGPICP